MSGNRTSPKMAVHSSCSPDVSSGERSERWRDEKAWCLISRQGLVHCVVRARKMGDQYAAQASLLSRCDCCMRTGIRVVREKIMVMALTPLATAASTLRIVSTVEGTQRDGNILWLRLWFWLFWLLLASADSLILLLLNCRSNTTSRSEIVQQLHCRFVVVGHYGWRRPNGNTFQNLENCWGRLSIACQVAEYHPEIG